MHLRQEAEQLEREIRIAFDSGNGYSFSDDPWELEAAVFSEDIQLLTAFLPVVGKWRLANLMSAKKILVQHGHKEDYGQYLTDDCIAVHVEFMGLMHPGLGLAERHSNESELYVLAMISSEVDRERLRYLVRDRGITDIDEIKEALKSMGETPPPLYSGTL